MQIWFRRIYTNGGIKMFLSELSREEQKVFLDLACTMINADERLTEEEEMAMRLYEQECVVSVADAKVVDFEKTILYFKDKSQLIKNKIFVELLGLALIDDDFDVEEKKIIETAEKVLGISVKKKDELLKLLNRTKQVYIDMNKWLME